MSNWNGYLLFITDRGYSDDGGNPVTLSDHLAHLSRWPCSTPDHWDNADDIAQAVDKARASGFNITIVDELTYQPLHEIKLENAQ